MSALRDIDKTLTICGGMFGSDMFGPGCGGIIGPEDGGGGGPPCGPH